MTDQELLEIFRRDAAERRSAGQPELQEKTAPCCRSCFAENKGGDAKCRECGRELTRVPAGKALACPEAGETDRPEAFVIKVGTERRALLGPGGKLIVGRGDSADIWLEHTTISRAHVEIAWDEGAAHPRFRDLGSANGTRHRGLLRAEGLLGNGDVLEVGPHRITVEREERAAAALGDTNDDLASILFDRGPELSGELGSGTASTILRALAVAERTGTFQVALPRGTGSVVLAAGRIVSARCGRTVGLAALHVILSADAGAYRFVRTFEVDDGEPVDLTVEQVLAVVPC